MSGLAGPDVLVNVAQYWQAAYMYFINIITYIIGASSDGGKYTTSHKLKKTPIFITIKQSYRSASSLHQVYLNTCSRPTEDLRIEH